jgi:hypothetical protein
MQIHCLSSRDILIINNKTVLTKQANKLTRNGAEKVARHYKRGARLAKTGSLTQFSAVEYMTLPIQFRPPLDNIAAGSDESGLHPGRTS